ncbi:MAG: TonB-dependent receptor [Chlorobi bacterium]|nr:TonB-dependent receptor [Chlorobiota bacterium]
MKKTVLIILAVSMSMFTTANKLETGTFTSTIRGKVIDKDTEMPLVGATVVLPETVPQIGTITNEEGEFTLQNIPIGRHNIQVSYVGYNTVTMNNLMLNSGKELILNVELIEKVYKTNEVVVKANARKDKAINKMATVSARSFTVEETERFAGSLGDPSRMVANYAGVMAAGDQRNDIIIRGNSPIGLLWRLDGIDIPNPNHFGALGTTGGPVSMLNNNLLTNSDFFTGAFPAEYGNAISGVFDLRMRNGNNKKNEYVGQIGFNGFELGAEGPFSKKSKASYLVNYRYSTLSVFNMLGINVGVGSSIPQYQDLSFKINIPGTKLGHFSLFGIGGLSFIALHDSEKDSTEWSYGLAGTDTDFGSDMGVIGLKNTYFFNETSRIITKISLQGTRGYTNIDSLRNGNVNDLKPFFRSTFSEVKYSFEEEYKQKINTRNFFHAGITFEHYDVNYVDSVDILDYGRFITRVNTDGQLILLKGFAQWQHKFSDILKLNAGVYYQQLTLNNSYSVEPRIGLNWNFSEGQSLNAGFGMHSQMQTRISYFTLSYDSLTNVYNETNHNLDFIRSNHFVIGYDNLINTNLRLKTETYFQYITNAAIVKNTPEFSMLNAGDYFYIPVVDSLENGGLGMNYGVELTLEKFLSNNYYFLFTTSLFESKYTGYDKIWRNTAFDGNFVVNALFGYEKAITDFMILSFNFRTVWAGGKRYIPIDLEKSIKNGIEMYYWDKAYENRYDDYFKIDGRISFKLNGKKINQEWAVDVQNITNNQNIFNRTFDPVSKTINTEYQSKIFPMVLYRIQF